MSSGNGVLLVFTIQNRLQEMQKNTQRNRQMLSKTETMGPVPTHAPSLAGYLLSHIILSRILNKANMANIFKIGH